MRLISFINSDKSSQFRHQYYVDSVSNVILNLLDKVQMLEVDAFILSRNRAQFIGDAIKSLLLQSYPFKSIAVLDNQSSDNTDMIVSGFPNVEFL